MMEIDTALLRQALALRILELVFQFFLAIFQVIEMQSAVTFEVLRWEYLVFQAPRSQQVFVIWVDAVEEGYFSFFHEYFQIKPASLP